MRDHRGPGGALRKLDVLQDARRLLPGAGRDVLAGVEREDAEAVVEELGRRSREVLLEELGELGVGHRYLAEVRIELRQDAVAGAEQRRGERAAERARLERPALEVQLAVEEGLGDRGGDALLQLLEPRLLLEQQPRLLLGERLAARAVALHHLRRPRVLPRDALDGAGIADDPDQPVAQRVGVAALDPDGVGALVARAQEAEVDGDRRFVARVLHPRVVKVPAVGEERRPREGPAFVARPIRRAEQLAQLAAHDLGDLLAGDADVLALALPLLAGRALDLVAVLLGVAEQVGLAQPLERLGDGLGLVAVAEPAVEALRDEPGVGRLLVLDQLEQRHGLRRAQRQRVVAHARVVEDARERRLHVGLERRVLHLEDGIEGHQVAHLALAELLLAEQLAEKLQKAADGVVVALRAGRARAQVRGDVHQQLYLARQHRVDLEEVLLGDLLAAEGVELQLGPMALEQLAQQRLVLLALGEQPLVDDVADVGRVQVDAQRRREAVLELADVVRLVGVLELLLAGREDPDQSLQLLAELGDERLQRQHPVLVLVDVLAHLVDDDEERLALGADGEHRVDGLDHLAHAGADPGARAGARVEPAHRVDVGGGVEHVHHVREVVLGELVVLGQVPGLAERLLGELQEAVPFAVALELELVLGDEVALRAVAEPRLHLAQRRAVDLLVVAGDAADVEDDGDGVDALAQRLPGLDQLGATRGVVAGKQRFGEGAAVGQRLAVEGEAEQLGEARLAGAVEAGDPRGGKSRAAVLLQLGFDGPQKVDELLVDAGLEAPGSRVVLGKAAGDDVLRDLGLELLGALLVEVDDRRDVAGDVVFEEVADEHSGYPGQIVRTDCCCAGHIAAAG